MNRPWRSWFLGWTRSIRARVVLFILISGLIPLLLAGWFIHRFASRTLLSQHGEDLRHLAVSQVEILEAHIKHIVIDTELLAGDSAVVEYARALRDGRVDDETYRRAGLALARTQNKRWGDIHHIMLLDRNGTVVMNPPRNSWLLPGFDAQTMRSVTGPHTGASLGSHPQFLQGLKRTSLSGIFGFAERDHFHQLVFTPVTDEMGETMAVLVAEIVLDRLNELLAKHGGRGGNNVFLATKSGVRVVDKKSDLDEQAMWVPWNRWDAHASGVRTGVFNASPGRRMLGAYHPSSIFPWIVCVEKPEGEALQSAVSLTRSIMTVLLAGLCALTLLAYLIGTVICRPIRQLVVDAARVADGDIEHEIKVTSHDEIGQLQHAVEQVRCSLNQQIDHLDALVAERTEELEHVNEKLERAAQQDMLTGLANRQVMMEAVERELKIFKRMPSHLFSVLFFDFDRFKIVNDSLGHGMGDKLLCSIADRFRANLRDVDLAARFGGDEFVVCLGPVATPEHALRAAQRLLRVFEEAHELQGHRIVTTASIGLVVADARYNSAEEMIRDADAAMYEAKLAGKGQVVVFDERMHQESLIRVRIEEDLSRAVERGQLRVVYQPIIGLEPLGLVGFEALMRWEHPELGLVRPDHFIPIAEDTGLIVEIGEWILRRSLRQLRAWDRRHGRSDLTINVNVAKRQLIHPGFIDMVESALSESDIEPQRLKLEITESTAIDPRHDMSETIRRVHDLGVQIAMDDFGTGHSSLSLLHKFDLDVIKIDKSFIQGMGDSREMSAVLHSIIALAQNMGKKVVAEGAETELQIACLISHGCDMVQGYYFAKPLSARECDEFIASPIEAPKAA